MECLNSNPTERQYLIENAHLTVKQADFVCNWIALQQEGWREKVQELELSSLKTAHQEELGNYNSYAAIDMENRHDKAIGELIMKIEDERNLASDMMGTSANAVVKAYNSVIAKINMINLDNF